jgi:hypothetical protein
MEPTQLQCSRRNIYKKREENKAMHNVMQGREVHILMFLPCLLACFRLSQEAAAARALAGAASSKQRCSSPAEHQEASDKDGKWKWISNIRIR